MTVYVTWAPYLWKRYVVRADLGERLELLNEQNQRIHIKKVLAKLEPPNMAFIAVEPDGCFFICEKCGYRQDLSAESGLQQDTFCKEHNRLMHRNPDEE